MSQLRYADSGYLEWLGKTNDNLDILANQIKKAKLLGEPIMVDYFEELREITLSRYKDIMIKLSNKQDTFVKERGEFFYTNR